MTLSIRNLVEFVLRGGDLDSRFMSSSRAIEGTKAHQKLQKSYGENYTAEITLKHIVDWKDITFILQGRADGIIREEDGCVIDEIKTTTRPLEDFEIESNVLHWAQVKCYGYIYGIQNQLENITLQLTYYHLETEGIKKLCKVFSIEELKDFTRDLIEKYYIWANRIQNWTTKRNQSIKNLDFPFETYRKGQRELAVAVYKTIREGKKLFVQAPTGTGKTISTLFPAVKAMGEGLTSKIFYLTAKTITRSVAEEGFEKMEQKGLRCKRLTLTAKEKICFEKGASCTPEECTYAKGHFDRVNPALEEIFEYEDSFSRTIIESYSQKHHICPFEFSLDLALWADCVICDYNYVFDPRVYLRRFFTEEGEEYTFLIDEAHNLVDRSREMFSAVLYKNPILNLKKMLQHKNKKLAKTLHQINTHMVETKKRCVEKENFVSMEEPRELYSILRRFVTEADEWLQKNERTEDYQALLDFYFEAVSFLRIGECYDSRYVTYGEKIDRDFKLKLFCLDPSFLLEEATKRGKAVVFFSATLTPISYFREILGGRETDHRMLLDSPFEEKNLCLLIDDSISTKYKNRETSYQSVLQCISNLISTKKGNYLVFFPSYKYMQEITALFRKNHGNVVTLEQKPTMTEEERELFLENFREDREQTLVGFAVMGGVFSEGIDLPGERLIGAIIIGVGLPQICLETDIIRDYFQKKNHKGYEYAYMYPGMNKVLQSVGRVIRREQDRGVVLLIDERFTSSTYKSLFPKTWRQYKRAAKSKYIQEIVQQFWSDR
ncbi:MAG: ATP-dependent DNA helicase [Thermotaleaceae bacterium]